MAKIYCPMELKKAESKLRYAVEMEEELTNVLAKALKNLISSVEVEISEDRRKRILQILDTITNDTEQHKNEIMEIIKSLKRAMNH
jgi:hypothetical protein